MAVKEQSLAGTPGISPKEGGEYKRVSPRLSRQLISAHGKYAGELPTYQFCLSAELG